MPTFGLDYIKLSREAVNHYRNIKTRYNTQILIELIGKLESYGISSQYSDFESKKTEVLGKLFDNNDYYSFYEMNMFKYPVYSERRDIAMIGSPASYQGVGISSSSCGRDLWIDGGRAMYTDSFEHVSMMKSVEECPPSANVFIAGLGLGLILLYLQESGKPSHIDVCEIDSRVNYLLKDRIETYFSGLVSIIENDAYDEVHNHPNEYDWIYVDMYPVGAPTNFYNSAQVALKPSGVYSTYDIYNWVWK